MKKNLIIAIVFLLSPLAQAEVLKVQAGLSFMRCEKVQEDTICKREEQALEDLEIDLNTPTEEGGLWGEVRFTTFTDGVDFEGTIEIKKIIQGEKDSYELEVFVASVPQEDPAKLAFDFIGMSKAKGSFSNFNDLIFTGRTVNSGEVTLTPFISIRIP